MQDTEPDRDQNYYEWLCWWYRQPENQERAREIERIHRESLDRAPRPALVGRMKERYIDAMQRDKTSMLDAVFLVIAAGLVVWLLIELGR